MRSGAEVVVGSTGVHTVSSNSACDQAAAELAELGECHSIPADLSKMNEVERLAGVLAAREQRLDILINNAGATWGSSFEAFPEEIAARTAPG